MMDAALVGCPKCGARLKVPSSVPAGQKIKCPKCGNLLALPSAAASSASQRVAAPVAPSPAKPIPAKPAAARPAPTKPVPARPAPAAVPLAPAMKRCQYCGEEILANAVKCRHCGEFLDPEKAAAAQKRRATAASPGDLNPAEYIVATIFCPVGLGIGIYWAIRRIAKAKLMLMASGLSLVIVSVCSMLVWFYVLRDSDSGPTVSGPMFPGQWSPPLEDQTPQQNPFGQRSGPEMPSGGEVDVTGQPPEIQRAMRANVRIELQGIGAQGSGVVIQRDGDSALILTNRHVVDIQFALLQRPTPLEQLSYPRITYLNKEGHPGTVVWLAPDGVDLALVKAPCPAEVEAVVWRSAPKLVIGDSVFAIGNPATLGWTLTKGIVSQLRKQKSGNREVPIIQTDASIGPGSSGGGLYNTAGELIGINSSIVNPILAKGLGFAIRTDVLMEFKPENLRLPSTDPQP